MENHHSTPICVLMIFFIILITVSSVFVHREIMHWKRKYKVSDILLSLLFPHPLSNFILRLLDMPKLSLNLIIPLTSVFQPQFLFRHAILAQNRAWQEKTEQHMCSNALTKWGNEAIALPHWNKKGFSSLAHRSVFESVILTIDEQTWLKSLLWLQKGVSEFNRGLPSQLDWQWRWRMRWWQRKKEQVILLHCDSQVIIQSSQSISWLHWRITGLSQLCGGHSQICI